MASDTFSVPTPAGVVADANASLGLLDETWWAARTPAELVGTLEELEALRSHLAAVEAGVLAEVTARKIAKTHLAWGSTADWFTHLAGKRRGEGRRTVHNAGVLTTERTATLAALTEGTISPEQAEVILAAIEELPTNPALRARAEAVLLEEAGRLNATDLATAARHLIEVIDPDRAAREDEKKLDRDERAAHLHRFLSLVEDGAGGIRLRGRGSVEDAAILKAALLPLTSPAPATDPDTGEPGIDPRDHGARLWDALIHLADQALGTELAPESHGTRPRVAVTIDVDRLRDQLATTSTTTTGAGAGVGEEAGVGVTDTGYDLSPATVRRLACDADLIPVCLGTQAQVLDVGRTHRLVTPALWTALVVRDRHCTFPGCSRPPVMCHAHHIRHWADGGTTALDNLVLLCGAHHRVIHHTPWEVRLNPTDARPEFLSPPRRGPRPRPIRHRPRRE